MVDELIQPVWYWRQHSADYGICVRCGQVLPEVVGRPIDIVLAERPVGTVFNWGALGLLLSRVLQEVLPLSDGHVTGDCLVSLGGSARERLSEFSTVYALPDAAVLVRGHKPSKVFPCEVCGQRIVQVLPPKYVLSYYILKSPSRVTWQDQFGAFYIHESLKSKFQGRQWSDIVLEPMAVVDAPVDGHDLPEDPRSEVA